MLFSKTAITFSLLVLLSIPLHAQSFNITFSNSPVGPAATYGAIGEAGNWNSLPGTHGQLYGLTNLAGEASPVTVRNIGGFSLQSFVDPGMNSDQHRLLDDYLVTTSTGLETCLFFAGLENGTYLVITYAWYGQNPMADHWVTVDESSEPGILVQGQAWNGNLIDGVNYSIHTAEVTNGALGSHSGVPSPFQFQVAALNAVQLVKLPDPSFEFIRGDSNNDGRVDIGDATAILSQLFAQAPSNCTDASDSNDDGQVNIADPIFLLSYLFIASSPAPPAPLSTCGVDPTADGISCDSGCP